MERPQNNAQLHSMLEIAGKKLGIPPEKLRQQLESGQFDSAIAAMDPQDADKFRQVLSNPSKLNQILSSRQAKALYEKLTKSS